jgi:dolichol-phosphate mannosyltransferase
MFDACVSSTGRPDLSLVICTLDEAASIGAVLDQARAALEGRAFEIIVVDDSADEATGDVVRAVAQTDLRIHLIRRTHARGLASAAICGWDAARGDVLGVMDGDGQHDAGILERLWNSVGDADVAVASRYLPGTNTGLAGMRRVISVAGTLASRALIGAPVSDPLSGLFLMRRDWYLSARPRLSGLGFKILADVLACGPRQPRVVEAPTRLGERIGGASKLDLRVMVELAAQLVQARSRGLISARFVMFGAVGATGVAVHMTMLGALSATGLAFWIAQLCAIAAAMTSNFVLNNALTFRDLRLGGARLWRGLAGFYLACASGGLISEIVGAGVNRVGGHWIAAGLAGALTAAMWNYWSASRAAWGHPPATASAKAASQPAPASIVTPGA